MDVNELDSILQEKCPKLYDAVFKLNELQYQFQLVYGDLLGILFSFAKEKEKK